MSVSFGVNKRTRLSFKPKAGATTTTSADSGKRPATEQDGDRLQVDDVAVKRASRRDGMVQEPPVELEHEQDGFIDRGRAPSEARSGRAPSEARSGQATSQIRTGRSRAGSLAAPTTTLEGAPRIMTTSTTTRSVEDNAATAAGTPAPRSAEKASSRGRRKVRPWLEESEMADEAVVSTPTATVMSSLVQDTGSGRKSARWGTLERVKYEEEARRTKERRARLRQVLRLREKARRVAAGEEGAAVEEEQEKRAQEEDEQVLKWEEEMAEKSGAKEERSTFAQVVAAEKEAEAMRESRRSSSSSRSPSPSLGVQTRLQNGRLVVDESTLSQDRRQELMDRSRTNPVEAIEERDECRMVNAASWSKRLKSSGRWTPEETTIFYKGLSMFGTDFEMISKLFPLRQRRHIRNKFNREEKFNSDKITLALKTRISVDLDEYGVFAAIDFKDTRVEDPILRAEESRASARVPEAIETMPAASAEDGAAAT